MYKALENLYGKYDVLELKSANVVYTNLESETAKARCRELNSGKGFAGWTPDFVCKGVKC